MRCSCCDAELSASDSTAKFVDSGTYVDMCSECRQWLPDDIKVRVPPPRPKFREVNPDIDDDERRYRDDELWDDL